MANSGDEDDYQHECWTAIEECRSLTPPYHPTAWIAMVQRWGAAEAARRVVSRGDIHEGFQRLIDAGRPDLTVEWSMLSPRWRGLFDAGHRDAAQWRLRQAGVDVSEAGART